MKKIIITIFVFFVLANYSIADGPELVVNGTMEADSNWADEATPTANVRSDVHAHSGTYSRKFTVDGNYDGIDSDNFTLKANKTYRIELWVYPDDGTEVYVHLREGDGTNGPSEMTVTGLTQDAWNKIVIYQFNAPAGVLAHISIQADSTPVVGDYYVDDVSVREVSGAGILQFF